MGTARVEPVLRAIRNGMAGAGMVVESAKGECNLGQHEIAFRYADALTTCDNHTIYKTGAKEIADRAGMALTFMAKYDEREGNSCHVHVSLRGEDGNVFAGDGGHGFSPLFEHFIATSTPTSGSPRARSRPPPSAGAWTTGRARSAWSGTGPGRGWRTGCRAGT
jgi:glutamine synthetase